MKFYSTKQTWAPIQATLRKLQTNTTPAWKFSRFLTKNRQLPKLLVNPMHYYCCYILVFFSGRIILWQKVWQHYQIHLHKKIKKIKNNNNWEGSREGSNPYELWGEPRFYSHIPLLKKKKKKFDKLSLCDIVLEAWEKKCPEVKIDQILKFI